MASRAELVLRANVMGFDPTTIPNDSKLEQHVLYLEKNASAIAGTLATGTITASNIGVATETITIGDVVYTWVTALTGVKAVSTITNSGTAPATGDTVTINGKSYTYRAELSSPAQVNEVLIGASVAISLDNLKFAINASGGTEGTEWSTGTVAHSDVTATTNGATTQVVEAREFGTGPNAFTTSETSAYLSWTGATLSGGVANVVNEIKLTGTAATELDNLKLAINNSATEGTEYSFGTKAHPQVTATTNGATTQVVEARDMAVGEDIATTETCTDWAWGATTLASAVADQNAVNAPSAQQTSGDKNANV